MLFGVSVGVAALVAVFTFVFHYSRADLAAEVEALRTQVAKVEATISRDKESPEPPSDPSKVFLPQNAAEIVARIRGFKWNEQSVVVDTTYRGKWIGGTGTIGSVIPIARGAMGFMVRIKKEPLYLFFTTDQRPVVETFDAGDSVVFEGKIANVDHGDVTLENVTVRRI
jgi:hypothetical protein